MQNFKFSFKLTQIIFLTILISSIHAQRFHDLNLYIENPKMFAENQEPTHVPLIPFSSTQMALENNWSKSPNYISLDGNWKFNWAINPYEAPADFYKENYDVSFWNEIDVPGVWQMQGYGWNI